MIEILILITFTGLLLSYTSRINIANPFFIYFFSWFSIFLAYYINQENYIAVSNYFLFTLIVVNFLAVTILCIQLLNYNIDIKNSLTQNPISTRDKYIDIAQILSTICAPIIYFKALQINGGVDLYTIQGYMLLRQFMTEDSLGYGPYSYIMVMAYVISSIRLFQFIETKKKLTATITAIINSLFYVYLSTGRTFALLLLTLLFLPGIVINKFKLKSLLFIVGLFIAIFAILTIMTSKGVDIDSGASENIKSLGENLISYTVAPILAFSKIFDNIQKFDYGQNTFRTFIAALHSLNLIELKPLDLIKEYELVPNATNVYTVFEVYFRDFAIAGMLLPPIFLIIHFLLYKKAIEMGGNWIFYYSTSAYPLVMQFFQDQYFTLLSMMMQIIFWYAIFIRSNENKKSNANNT